MTPCLSEYQPLEAQIKLHKLLRGKEYNHKGVLEILLSGSIGSSKSLGMAHEIVMQNLICKNSSFALLRKDMPALKDTILKTVLDHMGTDVSYAYNKTRSQLTFANNATTTCLSWGDGQIKKFRSYEFDGIATEELTENETDDFYKEILQRVGRRKWFKRPFTINATNPDSPSHWAHKHFIDTDNPNRVVIYSRTIDNPHIPPEYIENLKRTLTEKEVRRQIYGEWIEITKDIIYYAYKRESNFINKSYQIRPDQRVDLFFDFNIGQGKPMSAGIGVYELGVYHIVKDFVVEGARTADICSEIIGHLKEIKFSEIRLFGDASGRNRDTRGNKTDWDIILHSFSNAFSCKVTLLVPTKNPPIRDRHNKVNGFLENSLGQNRLFVYQDAKVADEGFRLTSFKKNSNLEDDSKYFQHITTAIGYYIHMNELIKNTKTREY